jgi:hypothetical protein
MRWDFKLAFLFPPIPLLRRVLQKLELSRGTFFLVTPYWEAQTWFASLQALQVVVFPSATTSSSTCRQGSLLHPWSGSS